jgi:ribonucleoside-diphosphate reductase alpha chain
MLPAIMTKSVKADKIFRRLAENNYNMAEPGILFWDRIENYNILSNDDEFKYAGVNPCAEEPLPNGGSCLLGSFNLSSYVYYNHGDKASFDFEDFKKDIRKAVKAMNEILDEGLPLHPLEVQKQTVYNYRQIGIGVMGIADMLIKLGLKYDSKEAIEFCDHIGEVLADNALYYSALEARDHGCYPKYNADAVLESYYVRRNASERTLEAIKQYGLRNSQLLTIAPTGTLSTMLGISGGIEPIFSFSYTRKTQSLHGEDVFYKVYTPIAKNYMDEHNIKDEEDLPEFFVTAQTLDPFLRVKMQAAWQKHIDASISSTINLPNIATIDMIEDLYIAAWYEGLKGLTIFRDGCARMGVLTLNSQNDQKDEKHENDEKSKKEQKADKGLKFGDTLVPSDNSLGLKRTILSGCGTMHVNAYFDEETGELREVFLNKGSKGGCVAFTNAVSRLISLLARKGAPVEEIADQLNSVVVCPSYAAARAAGKKVSPGSSCASSIAKALLDMHAEFKLKYMDHDDEDEESIEPEKIDLNKEQVRKEVAGPEYSVCPECKEKTMFYSGGCVSCNNCGYSKCN